MVTGSEDAVGRSSGLADSVAGWVGIVPVAMLTAASGNDWTGGLCPLNTEQPPRKAARRLAVVKIRRGEQLI
jgi:hypothetical protein